MRERGNDKIGREEGFSPYLEMVREPRTSRNILDLTDDGDFCLLTFYPIDLRLIWAIARPSAGASWAAFPCWGPSSERWKEMKAEV